MFNSIKSTPVERGNKADSIVGLNRVLISVQKFPVGVVNQDDDSRSHCASLHEHFLFFLQVVLPELLDHILQLKLLLFGFLQRKFNFLFGLEHQLKASRKFDIYFHFKVLIN